ncbi:hypothetical protein LCGC14_1629840 [marine sediment metagenome]|uniref:Uncharacterized protein n=1 Tax=marine sediment metagenome TaxID=412755 RepID=A0A0F9IQ14_9ZZZZ
MGEKNKAQGLQPITEKTTLCNACSKKADCALPQKNIVMEASQCPAYVHESKIGTRSGPQQLLG